ncbi:energy-coupling factor ABC transporter permease [Calorimonas adulescens]|uniref:Cobalamin biosynthesis protein CbiM n=1 Tax=Calorimonas adulescens TaxID=2606906 RepID=A0A5D8QEP0_9THEO|nr:hypothetical protein FWJ32_04730 [Calorimonas adulescens]
MHIPDGFINVRTAAATYAVSAAFVGYSMKKAKKTMENKNIL